jgi:hypothetical protein
MSKYIAQKIVELTPAEKSTFLKKHFKYEVDMLTFTYKKEEELAKGKSEKVASHNMAVESFLLHARNLADFFLWDGQKEKKFVDDSYAIDFVDQDIWVSEIRDLRRTHKVIISNLKKEISKHIAHLTYSRPLESDQPQKWQMDAIYEFLVKLAEEFQGKVGAQVLNIAKQEDSESNTGEKIDLGRGYTGPCPPSKME